MSYQAQYLSPGDMIDYTPSVAAVSAGQVVVVNGQVFIAVRDIAIGEQGALRMAGAFDVVKDTSTFAVGDAWYWDADGDPVDGEASTGAATSTAAGNTFGGSVKAAAATGDATVRAQLTNMTRTTTIAGAVTATDLTGSDTSLGIAGLPAATGTAGAVVVAGGAGTADDANGGAVTVNGGNANGSGTDGAVNVGAANTSQVNLAAASIPPAIVGPLNRTPGASTAAAGSTYADAGALPAGTAGVYPTTAADDTKGVIVNAADKVTGRMLFIGNGVANKILKVYGPSGATINGGSANAAFSSASGKGVILVCLDAAATTWLAW